MRLNSVIRALALFLPLQASLLSPPARADDNFYDIPPPGQRIDIGGYKLHIHCEGSGSPTVILEAGLGDWSSHWTGVRNLLKNDTRVCAYDRAGYGWSDPGPRPRSSARMAVELHALLEKAGIPPPYILVGHSFGGFVARLFGSTHADEVAGVVLVDASHPGSMPYQRDENVSDTSPSISNYLMLMEMPAADTAKLPPEAIPAVSDNLLHTKSLSTARAEYRAMAHSVAQVQQAPGLGDIPLIVISRNLREWGAGANGDLREQSWQAQQDELVRLSRQGSRKIAPQSGHHIYLDEPELVAGAIRELVMKEREKLASPSVQP